MAYTIYCDESANSGHRFSDFYGGALVRTKDMERISAVLAQKKLDLNLNAEVKWTKVSEGYLEKYVELVNSFFNHVERNEIKLRIMFTSNLFIPKGLKAEHVENKFFILYYQFIKHAFGLQFANSHDGQAKVQILLDKLPDTREKSTQFKKYLEALSLNPQMKGNGIHFLSDQIAEVVSHEHPILQCLDIVLGSMNFRLNDLHLQKPVGAFRRGKRTIAKEKLYKLINKRICSIYPNFNVGITTGLRGDHANRWRDPYRHWVFVPKDRELDPNVGKHKRKSAP